MHVERSFFWESADTKPLIVEGPILNFGCLSVVYCVASLRFRYMALSVDFHAHRNLRV